MLSFHLCGAARETWSSSVSGLYRLPETLQTRTRCSRSISPYLRRAHSPVLRSKFRLISGSSELLFVNLS